MNTLVTVSFKHLILIDPSSEAKNSLFKVFLKYSELIDNNALLVLIRALFVTLTSKSPSVLLNNSIHYSSKTLSTPKFLPICVISNISFDFFNPKLS